MKTVLLIASLSTLLFLTSTVHATSCSRFGSSYYCDNGDIYSQYGNTLYDNHGHSWSSYHGTTYGSDGSIYSKYGASTSYDSEGRTWSQYGNVIYLPDTSSCSFFDKTIYCPPRQLNYPVISTASQNKHTDQDIIPILTELPESLTNH